MKIKKININNIASFPKLGIDFSSDTAIFNHIIFIGNNGAGKTTILESIATSLSWYINRIKTEKSQGTPIKELSITNGENAASIQIEVSDLFTDETFSWQISKARKGKINEYTSNYESLNKLVKLHREAYTNTPEIVSFPLITYYNAHRGVLDIPMRIRTKHDFEQLNGYDNCLKGSVDYRTFFEWFREREDVENAEKISFFEKFNDHNFEALNEALKNLNDKQLDCVRKALTTFLPNFTRIRVERKPTIHMAVDKDGIPFNLEQLSQGEKLLMAMIGDIARRLTILNPYSDNPLEGSGIVLIDEAELHLHPRWQRSLIEKLSKTFPNCQFIYTTHSPLLISDYKEVLCFSLENGELNPVNQLYGLDVNQVLLEAMDTDIRNSNIQQMVDDFRDYISKKQLDKAQQIFAMLRDNLPANHIEIIKSQLLLKKLELKSYEKDNQRS